jgi:Ca-activated chloride channel family protein
MKKKNHCILISLFLFANSLHAQQVDKIIKTGNDLYKQKQYEDAEKEYRKALEQDSLNTTAQFNLGNSIYRTGKLSEASTVFSEITSKEKKPEMRANAFYNDGVMLTKQQKLEESIEAYKNALRNNPSDKEARENLQKALIELKKRNPPKNENQKKQPKSKMNQKEAEQKLKLLQQKEKEVQQRLQKNSKSVGALPKDW